jgi:hypothetical protein
MDPNPTGLMLGVIGIAIGLALVLRGFRLFLFLLPVLGFLGGFLLGANFVEHIFGDAFLGTVLGWAGGFLLGLVFAVLSYFYYWLAVGIFGGVLGYQLTVGVLAWIGLSESGVLTMTLGFVAGLDLGVAFLLLRMPTVLAIVGTAIAGAASTVAGLALALGVSEYSQLRDGIVGIFSGEELGLLGALAIVMLSLAGMVVQVRLLTPDDHIIDPGAYRNPGIGGPGPGGPGGPAPA